MDYTDSVKTQDAAKIQDDFNKKLIVMVRKYPLLYDVHHMHYRNSKQRHYAWNEVARLLNTTNKDCRWRWKALREHWKRQKSFNDSNRNMPNRKYFEYFEDMAYANTENMSPEEIQSYADETNLLIPSVCINTIPERSVDQDALNGYCKFVAGNELSTTVMAEEVQPKIEEVDLTIEEMVFEDQEPDSGTCVDHANRNKSEMHAQSQTRQRKEQSSFINSTSGELEDECLIAGRRIGYQLRSVDDFQRTIAEKLISDIIYNAKMGNLTENSNISLDVTQQLQEHSQNGRKPVQMEY